MRGIQQASFALLAVSVVFLLLVVAGYAFDRYATPPPLYTPPPEIKGFSYVNMMQEATSLEGLRTICTTWAQNEDRVMRFVTAQYERSLLMVREVAVALLVLAGLFGTGSLYIYLTVRRFQRAHSDAF